MSRALNIAFPAMRAHEGVWTGTYTHLDAAGCEVDRHESRVVCEFPASGQPIYVQHITFTWPDGRAREDRFDGRIAGDRIVFDTPSFSGAAWESGELVLLHLDRKDEPGAYFIEIIALADGGRTRARTWHWFKAGALIRRTLCDEVREA
ncbi:MAG: hypothetical protein ACFE0P_08320 [Oceanicaulis sp.]